MDSSCPNIEHQESHNDWTTPAGSPQGEPVASANPGSIIVTQAIPSGHGLGVELEGGVGGERVLLAANDDVEWLAFRQPEPIAVVCEPHADLAVVEAQ